MKTCILLSVFLLTVLLSACGTDNPAQAAETNQPENNGPLLWKVNGDAGSAWLFGSVHALREADLPLDEEVIAAYEKAELLVMELDMDALNPVTMQKLTLELGTFSNGKTLQEAISPTLYKNVQATAKQLGIPMLALNRFEPWLVALMLQQTKLQKLDFHAAQGVETLFTGMAVTDNKPIEGLETLEQQLNLFDDLPMAAQQEFLTASLNDIEELEEQLNEIVAAWSNGDAAALAALSRESFAEDPLLYDRLVSERNRAWVQKLTERLNSKEQTVLIIVGALHLVGEESVTSLLEKQGLEVIRQ